MILATDTDTTGTPSTVDPHDERSGETSTLVRRLVFWQSTISPHQAACIRSLAGLRPLETVYVAAAESLPDRRELGWDTPDMGNVRVVIAPDAGAVESLLCQAPDCTVHLVSGVSGLPYHQALAKARRRLGVHCGVIAEGGDPRGLKGAVRHARYRLLALRSLKAFDFLLAMGEAGVRWYQRAGWARSSTYPFAYATDEPEDGEGSSEPGGVDTEVRILFAGQLVARKGLDIAIRALVALKGRDGWHLDVIGTGADRSSLERLVGKADLASRVSFLGALPRRDVRRHMGNADLLVLPSRFDGWGAVVNEALQEGTPVLCSNMCGAGVLLTEPVRGEVVPVGQVEHWARALEARILQGRSTDARRSEIRLWSQRALSGRAIGQYFLKVLDHAYGVERVCPRPPWCEDPGARAGESR